MKLEIERVIEIKNLTPFFKDIAELYNEFRGSTMPEAVVDENLPYVNNATVYLDTSKVCDNLMISVYLNDDNDIMLEVGDADGEVQRHTILYRERNLDTCVSASIAKRLFMTVSLYQ